MSNYHGRIMNLPVVELIKKNDTKDDYLRGHRDARHAAAELALEAGRQIEAAEQMRYWVRRLLADLPARRDWLDPDIEKSLRAEVGDEKEQPK